MINSLYDKFKDWCKTGSIWIISDLHFEDKGTKLMCPDWISPEEQIDIINRRVHKTDTFVCLGDVGNPEWIKKIKSNNKILIMGNHDTSKTKMEEYFNEVYEGPLFISEKILLSHEPISLPFCINIHGHDHSNKEYYADNCRHLNLAANVCNYTPINLGERIKKGLIAHLDSIHRITIDRATVKARFRKYLEV